MTFVDEVNAAATASRAPSILHVFEMGDYSDTEKYSGKAWDAEKAKLQKLAKESGQKFVLLSEGRDATGKTDL